MPKMISCCGLNCASCEAYLATISGDENEKIRIAAEWSKRYDSPINAENINCEGCHSDGARFAWCYKCPIRACVVEKDYQSCAECELLPCETNQWLYDAVPEVKENLEELRSGNS
ncbi:MAG: DUF3795 domain-containing protein [Candidatus Cloacimonadota bacterium]